MGNKLLPGISPCDSDGLPDFYNWGFDKTYTHEKPLLWYQAKQEIDQGQAFAFSRTPISPTGSLEASHMLVVVGYEIDGTDQKLVVLNPIFDKDAMMMTIAWEEYAGQDVGSTAWHNDENYFGITVR